MEGTEVVQDILLLSSPIPWTLFHVSLCSYNMTASNLTLVLVYMILVIFSQIDMYATHYHNKNTQLFHHHRDIHFTFVSESHPCLSPYHQQPLATDNLFSNNFIILRLYKWSHTMWDFSNIIFFPLKIKTWISIQIILCKWYLSL